MILASFNVLPVALFVFTAFLAVRAHSGIVEDPEVRLQKDLAALDASPLSDSADAAKKKAKKKLAKSATDLKKTAKTKAYYPGASGYRYPSGPELDFYPYGWLRYGPSGR